MTEQERSYKTLVVLCLAGSRADVSVSQDPCKSAPRTEVGVERAHLANNMTFSTRNNAGLIPL